MPALLAKHISGSFCSKDFTNIESSISEAAAEGQLFDHLLSGLFSYIINYTRLEVSSKVVWDDVMTRGTSLSLQTFDLQPINQSETTFSPMTCYVV